MQLSLATLALPGVPALAAPHTLLAEAALTLAVLAGCCCCCGLLLGESPSMIGRPAPDRPSCCSWWQSCRLTGPPVDVVAESAGSICLLTEPAALAGLLAAAAPACQLLSDGPPRLGLAWVLLPLLLAAAWMLPRVCPCRPVLRGVVPAADAVSMPADTLRGCALTEPCGPLYPGVAVMTDAGGEGATTAESAPGCALAATPSGSTQELSVDTTVLPAACRLAKLSLCSWCCCVDLLRVLLTDASPANSPPASSHCCCWPAAVPSST